LYAEDYLMSLLNKILIAASIMSIGSAAYSATTSTMRLINASSCHITDSGNVLGEIVELFSYNRSMPDDIFTQYSSLNPQGDAPFVEVDGVIGVYVGEAGMNNLTYDETNKKAGFIVTNVSSKMGCSVKQPCYTITKRNPCLVHNRMSNKSGIHEVLAK
jgi:hypothetical protein